MEHGILTQLGLAGILIYLFLKEMFAFLGKKKNGNGHSSGDTDKLIVAYKEEGRLMRHELRNISQLQLSGIERIANETIREMQRLNFK